MHGTNASFFVFRFQLDILVLLITRSKTIVQMQSKIKIHQNFKNKNLTTMLVPFLMNLSHLFH